MRLDGKIALITGAGSGFGAEMARLFASEGAKVVVVDIDAAAAAGVSAEIESRGGAALALAADVSEGAAVRHMIESTGAWAGGLDILVNNAGVSHPNMPFEEVSEEAFERVFAVNVKGVYLTIQAALPYLERSESPVILNTSSTAALRPRPGLSVYNSSKGAVQTLSKSLALELAPRGIRVNALCPVMGETGLLETFMGLPDTAENRARFTGGIPLGRLSRPTDIARAALFLVSQEAEFITGVGLDVDGGRSV